MSFESNILLLNVFLARLVYPYGKEFMPYKFTKLIKTNKIAQLIICFLLIYFTFEISDNINSYKELSYNFIDNIYRTFIVFILYIIVTKQSLTFFLISIFIGFVIYAIYTEIEKNKELTNERKELLKSIKTAMLYVFFVFLCIGFSLYFVDKYKKYRKKSKYFYQFLLKFMYYGSLYEKNLVK